MKKGEWTGGDANDPQTLSLPMAGVEKPLPCHLEVGTVGMEEKCNVDRLQRDWSERHRHQLEEVPVMAFPDVRSSFGVRTVAWPDLSVVLTC